MRDEGLYLADIVAAATCPPKFVPLDVLESHAKALGFT